MVITSDNMVITPCSPPPAAPGAPAVCRQGRDNMVITSDNMVITSDNMVITSDNMVITSDNMVITPCSPPPAAPGAPAVCRQGRDNMVITSDNMVITSETTW